MELYYWFEFTDVKQIVHRVEISREDYLSAPLQIYGSCSLEYSETDDTLEAVRGSGLRIDLEADSSLTFNDLYSEEERTFSVVYIRDNETLFNGWLSPEGIYESLVSDKWVISLDCTDGLGFLGNLSYVEDSTGLTFSGKQSLLEIVVNCLKRTKTPQNILTAIDIYYDGLTQTLDPFANVYFNADRFVKDDDNTIMNCDEVLKSVLEPFGAVITAYKGEWLIYKPNSLFDSSSEVFFAYDSLGVALGSPTRTIDFALDLGSQIDSYYPHHANANQQKTVKSSIGAFRINYKYGFVRSFLTNKYLSSNSDTDIPGYTILNGTYLSFPADRQGIIVSQFSTITAVLETSDTVTLPLNSQFDFFMQYSVGGAFVFGQFEVILTGTSNTYYLKKLNIINQSSNSKTYSAEWVTAQTYLTTEAESTKRQDITLKPETLPEAGTIKVIIYTADQSFGSSSATFNVDELNLIPSVFDDNLKGENHTFQRILKPSSKIKDIKEVFNGDDESDIYVGTIYKADETTTTDVWTRFGAAETKPILQIMGEERMKMYSKPLQVYSGDVYGYFNYLSLFTINNLTGKFMPTKYNYDALTNITSLELTEVLNTDVLADIDYAVTFDYGNVVEPTIKG
tara:strand:- start:515 stop:2386 length:1872 start_codon:yes stop_codon:yes gene_type:complete